MRPSFPQARRRGQALLLAVLIMIFAALLSAAFIGVVATNLNQTARQTDKDRAFASARAGVNYINRQLTYSAQGDKWRSEIENVPPAPGDSDYGAYYTALDIAQGWARVSKHATTDQNGDGVVDIQDELLVLADARANGKMEMVKSPDPRNVPSDGPQFLSKVERLPYRSVSTDPDHDKAGALKVTVIGLSPDDPTAYQRLTFYKGGYQNSPVGRVMRAVSNADEAGNVLVAQIADATDTTINGTDVGSRLLNVKNATGDFSQLGLPFSITVSDPRQGVVATSAVVTSVSGNKPNFSFTLATALPPTALTPPSSTTPSPTVRIELAANLGAPSSLNFNNSLTPTPVPISVNLSDTSPTPSPNEVNSARINAGLVFSGTVNASRLRAANMAFSATPTPTPLAPGSIEASGVMALDSAAASAVTVSDGSITDTLTSSTASGVFSGGLSLEKDRLVSDGWNRLAGNPAPVLRSVADFRPPNISSGEGVERYRDLTRLSKPLSSGDPAQASLYGYGQGIYIDNREDKEKITSSQREMTQTELVRMWLSNGTSSYMRTGTASTVATESLEQQHLRGWVGPDEFRARGVEIELGNNSLIITRDPRGDNTDNNTSDPADDKNTLAAGPVRAKAWRDSSGNLLTGVYRQTFPWPANGVVFAEGNVRIKGNATNVPRSLTVVSMGNIYIEGSLSADDSINGVNTGTPRKVLLLARKNVVMNPTRVLGRPDAQTIVPSTASSVTPTLGTPTTITVADGTDFHIGDVIRTSTTTAASDSAPTFIGQVTAAANTTLTVNPLYAPGAIAPSDASSTSDDTNPTNMTSVRIVRENPVAATGSGTSAIPSYSKLVSTQDAITRRFQVLTANANLRFAFNHAASRIPAFNVAAIATTNTQATPIPTPASGVYLTNRLAIPTPIPTSDPSVEVRSPTISQAQKTLRVDFTEPESNSDIFPTPIPTNQTDADAQTVTAVSTAMNGISHVAADESVGWKYQTSPVATYAAVPFYYLAGVGNRYAFGKIPALPTSPYTPKITAWMPGLSPAPTASDYNGGSDIVPRSGAATPYQVPLATSVGVWLDAKRPTLTAESYMPSPTPTTTPGPDRFGFNPDFTAPEDVLTSDQAFYSVDPAAAPVNVNKSFLDSRSMGTLTNGEHSLAFFETTGISVALPNYYMMAIKVEDVTIAGSNTAISAIKPGYSFDVNAYVYAQNGSWFVIPGSLYNDRLHGDVDSSSSDQTKVVKAFLDLNNDKTATLNAGEYVDVDGSGDFSAGDFPDLNHNGIVDDVDKYAVARFFRYNYQINFTGAIAENQTALVNDVGSAKGAVADWMNKWATTTYNGTAITYNRIQYVFDPSFVMGALDEDQGFRLPQTTDLIYQD